MAEVVRRSAEYKEGDVVRAPIDTGFEYIAIEGGRTSARTMNRWPRRPGVTVTDGSVTWAARHPEDVEGTSDS